MSVPFRFPKVLAAILASASAILAQTELRSPLPEPTVQLVAVLPFSAIGHDSSAGIILSDAIAMEILRTRKARVLERSQIKSILDEQGLQQSGLCDAQECAIQVGRILGVQRIVVGSVGKLGNTNTMTLRLVDVGSSEILSFASERTEGRLESMLQNAVRHSVESLFPALPSQAVPATPTGKGNVASTLDTARATSTMPSATPALRAIAPSALDLTIAGLLMGRGADLYKGSGFGLQARGWWNLSGAPWISIAGGLWHIEGVDYAGWAGRVATTATGYGATVRTHIGVESVIDVYGQYEFQHGYLTMVTSTVNADGSISMLSLADYPNRWVTLHTLGTGVRWKSPIPRLDVLGGYSFGFLGSDPVHRVDLSLLRVLTPR